MSQSLESADRVADVRAGAARPTEVGLVGPAASSGKSRRRVLIVDDDQNILSSLRRLLRRESYELVTAHNGEEALRAMEEKPADVVISDHRMPGMTGTQLLREIQHRWPDTVRIVLSGYSEVKAIIAAINEGSVYKFISKPWNDEEILLNVRRAVEQYELAAENQRMAREIAQQNEQLRELNRRLDERAADASSGQNAAQELLEALHAGMITVDENGLVVAANRKACAILHLSEREFIGLSAREVLPGDLYEVFCGSSSRGRAGASGQLEVAGRRVEWCLGPVGEVQDYRGTIVTLWEGVS